MLVENMCVTQLGKALGVAFLVSPGARPLACRCRATAGAWDTVERATVGTGKRQEAVPLLRMALSGHLMLGSHF